MAEVIPQLPEHVSNDGKEIWDWAAKMGDFAHQQQKKRELRQQIAEIENTCGSCRLWMTSSCPRETHNNKTGRSQGPSMRAQKCGEFSMTKSDADLLEKGKAELASLEAPR